MKHAVLMSVTCAGLLVGCGDKGAGGQPTMAPLVITAPVEEAQHYASQRYVGRTIAKEDVGISAQVSGYLVERLFNGGEYVEQGQVLYRIEDHSYKAAVASAKAELANAEANLTLRQLDRDRKGEVLSRGGISQTEFDHAEAQLKQAKAVVMAAKAGLTTQEINLAHTQIRAPFGGVISNSKASIGDLVSPSSGELATLVSLQPMQASFHISDRERLSFQLNSISAEGDDLVDVKLILSNNQTFTESGSIDYLDNRIDLNTGTFSVRAGFDNTDKSLLPGQYVQVELRSKSPMEVVRIPRAAVQTDLEGSYVMVVGEDNIAHRRMVTMGDALAADVIIDNGLQAGEQIIVQGLQRARPGMPVQIAPSAQAGS